jgi:pimeloyl-ACP methyl ester carboxylesterase
VPDLTTADGRRLAWRETGTGPPLLCHPGGPGFSSRCFGDLRELAGERALLLLDPRGTGESDRPADSSAYDLADYAADVEAVRERLGLERLDLLGHSHGGFVAINWAGTHPERVGRLVLAGTTARFMDEIRAERQARVASHAGQPYFDDALAALQAHHAGEYADDAELQALYRREWRLFMPVGTDPQTDPVVAAMRASGPNADALRHFNARVAPAMDQRALLPRIGAPTLVISGGEDAFGEAADELAGALPDATLVRIPGADHFAFLEPEHRGLWARAVLDFLAAQEGSAPRSRASAAAPNGRPSTAAAPP